MLKDRLIEARKASGLTQSQVAEAIGVTQSSYSQLETGKVSSSSFLPSLAKVLNVDAYWLQTGETPLDISKLPHGSMPVEEWDDDTPLDDDEFEVPFFKDFLVSCGSGTVQEALQNERRKLRMGKQTARRLGVSMSACAAVTADGDSMAHTINDGDTVTIDTDKTRIKDGKIFAICYGGHFYFKRLYNQPFGGVKIVSDNKSGEYPDIELTKEQLDNYEFKVIGQVWSIQRIEPL